MSKRAILLLVVAALAAGLGLFASQRYFATPAAAPGPRVTSITLLPEHDPRFPNLLVFRREQRMQFQSIRPAFGLFLQGIQRGENFATLCGKLAESFPKQDIPSLSLNLLLRAIDLELLRAEAAPSA